MSHTTDPNARAWVRGQESPWTWANLATVVRVVACLVIFAHAYRTGDETWNFVGLGVYWVLDVVDGALARAFDQETRIGAQLDILSDRLLVCLFYLNYVVLHPAMLVPVLLFLFQFMGIDHYLSNQFVRWPVKSPNYFYLVDRRIWAINWSRSGKLLNSAIVTLVLVGTNNPWAGSAVALFIIGLKVYSCVLLARIPDPEPGWLRPAERAAA
jgi:CDP-diacylglycerol--glycerol-3-phosphate 3-phosphatidyltransferase